MDVSVSAMGRPGVVQFVDDLPALDVSQLEASERAAWLIEVETGRLVAANAYGAALFGLRNGDQAPVFDASMPALVRLRSLAASGGAIEDGSQAPELLVFWTRNGVVRHPCRVHLTRAGTATIAAVTSQSGQQGETAATSAPGLRASLAHELKTPVSALAAAAEIMKDQRFGPLGSERYVGYASDIHSSAQHVLEVIERMLSEPIVAAEGAPSSGLDFSEIDARAVLETSVSQLVPLAEHAGITLKLDLAPRLPHLVADATSLRQIVFNLLTNALKFTDRGGHVTVSARYSLDGPLAISISDTGSGMTQREIEDHLAPAAHGRPMRRRKPGSSTGLGLGLPMVRALAAANGAELVIESAPGKGTSAVVIFSKNRVVPI